MLKSRINILAWNINKKDVTKEIVSFCQKYFVDILVLIEDEISPSKLLSALNEKSNYHFCTKNDRNIAIYSKFDKSHFHIIPSKNRFISFIEFNISKRFLLGGIHLSSKMTLREEQDRSTLARNVRKEIIATEDGLKHCNTIIIGDFNMMPFEAGMVEHESFNAVMSADIAEKIHRKVTGLGGDAEHYPYFYNPMWSFMGDLSPNSPGTYYWYDNSPSNHYRWNTFDQVLIRPCLIPNFVRESIRIIDANENGNKLINSRLASKPNPCSYDHLPIFLTLDFSDR